MFAQCESSVIDPILYEQTYKELVSSCTPPRHCSVEVQRSAQDMWHLYSMAKEAIEPSYVLDQIALLAPSGIRFAYNVSAAGLKASAEYVINGFGTKISNPVPSVLARVIPDGVVASTLGRPGVTDVFVTAADDIAGLTAAQIAERLSIPYSPSGFRVIEFLTPKSGVASPVNRLDPLFVGSGRTAGGAREFVIPNGPVPADAVIRVVK